MHGWVIRIGREALRLLLARRGVTFCRTRTWKESPDPERETELDRIEHILDRFPDRWFTFDEFGPLGIRPTTGSGWIEQGHAERLSVTYYRTLGVRDVLHDEHRVALVPQPRQSRSPTTSRRPSPAASLPNPSLPSSRASWSTTATSWRSRPGARYRDCAQPVSPRRPPEPTCELAPHPALHKPR